MIDMHSKVGKRTQIEEESEVVESEIGKFTSIAWNVSIGGNTHELNHLTTHSFLVYPKWKMGGNRTWQSAAEPCEIGNDVWIGAGANILRGVTIGDGAVIGANSVITKDVPAYAIVAGNPAHILRMRCEESWIERLEELQWWNLPEQVIREHFSLFEEELSIEVIEQMEAIQT